MVIVPWNCSFSTSLFRLRSARTIHFQLAAKDIIRIAFYSKTGISSILAFDLTRCFTCLQSDGGHDDHSCLTWVSPRFPHTQHGSWVTVTAIPVGSVSNPQDLKHIFSVLEFQSCGLVSLRAEFEVERSSPVDVDQARAPVESLTMYQMYATSIEFSPRIRSWIGV